MNGEIAAFLVMARDKMDEEQEKIRANGFVFDDLDERWQKLAFTFYSDIAEMSMQAKALLEQEAPDTEGGE